MSCGADERDNGPAGPPRSTRITDANLATFRDAREPRLLKTGFAGVSRDASWSVQGVHLHVFKAGARSISDFETRRGLTPPSFRSPNGTRAGLEPSRKTPAKLGGSPEKLGGCPKKLGGSPEKLWTQSSKFPEHFSECGGHFSEFLRVFSEFLGVFSELQGDFSEFLRVFSEFF